MTARGLPRSVAGEAYHPVASPSSIEVAPGRPTRSGKGSRAWTGASVRDASIKGPLVGRTRVLDPRVTAALDGNGAAVDEEVAGGIAAEGDRVVQGVAEDGQDARVGHDRAARERTAVAGGHRAPAPSWLDGAGVVTGALGSAETTAQVHPARFTTALLDAARTRGATLRIGVVERVVRDNGVARGVMVDGAMLEADAVVLAVGPWMSRVARGLHLPTVYGLKGYSVTLQAPDVPPHALFVDYRTADGRAFEPEIIPRPDGEVYVCGMADEQPLPESAEGVKVDDAACDVLARAAARVSTTLAAARVTRRQACYRPVTADGLPLIGRVPGVAGAYVATGHGPWGMLNAPATGLALAELITKGAASVVDLRPFDPARGSGR